MIEVLIAVFLDFLIGDPYNFPHPVKLMGNLINWEDNLIRSNIKKDNQLRIFGFLLTIINIIISFACGYYILKITSKYYYLNKVLSIYIIYTCLAAKSLATESFKVYKALDQGIGEARYKLSFIVGRDTSNLDEEGIIKASIETVAENTSDGVIAPLIYIFFLGPPGGLMYKMVNTMDSMLGYKNEKYIDFGKWPALIDDIYNYIPARMTGLLMCISSLLKYDYKNGFKILHRDKRKHESPNAGYPESAVAGLLRIELGGPNIYHGQLVDKPKIGDRLVEISKEQIKSVINIMYRTEVLCLLILLFCNFLFK